MKLGMYLKESWYSLRKDRVYSAVYIIGTGFSLALVMAYLTVQSMHFDNSYPEVNRDRMLVVPTFMESQKGSQGGSNAMVSQVFLDRFIRNEPVEGLEALTAVAYGDVVVANDLGEAVSSVSSDVDMEYWKVFDFDFLYGHALSETSYNQAAPEAVICESLARTGIQGVRSGAGCAADGFAGLLPAVAAGSGGRLGTTTARTWSMSCPISKEFPR